MLSVLHRLPLPGRGAPTAHAPSAPSQTQSPPHLVIEQERQHDVAGVPPQPHGLSGLWRRVVPLLHGPSSPCQHRVQLLHDSLGLGGQGGARQLDRDLSHSKPGRQGLELGRCSRAGEGGAWGAPALGPDPCPAPHAHSPQLEQTHGRDLRALLPLAGWDATLASHWPSPFSFSPQRLQMFLKGAATPHLSVGILSTGASGGSGPEASQGFIGADPEASAAGGQEEEMWDSASG